MKIEVTWELVNQTTLLTLKKEFMHVTFAFFNATGQGEPVERNEEKILMTKREKARVTRAILPVLKKIDGKSALLQYEKYGSKDYQALLFINRSTKCFVSIDSGNDYKKLGLDLAALALEKINKKIKKRELVH